MKPLSLCICAIASKFAMGQHSDDMNMDLVSLVVEAFIDLHTFQELASLSRAIQRVTLDVLERIDKRWL